MKMISRVEKLRRLERQSEKLRRQLGCSRPSEVIFQAPCSMCSNENVIVEADGFGGAELLVVEGNYPIDYSINLERRFPSEDEACEAAETMAQ